jgi:predicted ATPase/class 3 adenylate cyclase
MPETTAAENLLRPYLPRLLIKWLAERSDDRHRTVDGSIVFVDISGFTKLSERLAKLGKVGAEELTDAIGTCFARLLGVAYGNGGGLIKFGGDALLLLFTGPDHPAKACRAAIGMRRALREIGSIGSAAGKVTLRMSVGVHSGRFDFFLVGRSHRELIITGPAATETVLMESTAEAGEIVVSGATAAALPTAVVGDEKGEGYLLKKEPPGLSTERPEAETQVAVDDLVSAVPAAIRDQVLAGIDEPEHKRVTVAFLHFDGMDELIETAGREAAAGALAELVDDVQKAVDRHGICFLGTDVDRDGGKIILTAGAPTASGNDEERMLLALREIVGRGRVVSVRAGVNRGHVFAGDIGPHYRRTYTVMGDAVNLAARLMAKATPGQIVASDAVLERSRARFETTALEPFLVKGKSQPVHAQTVGAVSERAQGEAAAKLPLIGREHEMSVLLGALDSARRSEGRVVEILGEPGIGKSRLIEELRDHAVDMDQVSSICELYESSTPYRAFRSPLRALFGITETAADDDAASALRALVASAAPDLAPWIPLLAIPLGVEVEATDAVRQLDDEFRKSRLEEATVALLKEVLKGETLIVIEDVHWMDEASADLLGRIVNEAAGMPWMICVTRRDVSEGFVAAEAPHVVALRPQPLDEAAAAAMIDAVTADSPLAPHEIAALAERSGGNPFYLRELLVAAREAGGIEGLPDSVEALITARIDRLPPTDRMLLKRMSVLGPTFTWRLAETVVPEDVELDDRTWRRLEEFVEADGSGFKFRHALIRDAAYEGLPFRLRQRLHASIGEKLELGAGGAADELAEILSLHFFHARVYERAWRYSRISAERARSIYANVEAADFFERALESARKHGEIPAFELAAAHEALGDVRKRIGEFAKAAEAYRSAARLSDDDAIAHARLLLKQGRVRQAWGRFSEAVRWIGKANRALQGVESADAASQRAQAAVAYASVRKDQRRSGDVIRWCLAAIPEAEAAGDKAALANAYSLLEAAFVNLGQWEKAVYAGQALELYREIGDLWGQGVVFNNLGVRAYWEGRWDEAVGYYDRGREAWEKIGDAVNAATGTANAGEILSDQGRLDEAEPMLRKAMRIWQAAGDRASVAFALSSLGRLMCRRGCFDDALELLEEARTTAEEAGSPVDALDAQVRRAECLVLAGRSEQAIEVLDAVLERMSVEGDEGQVAATIHRTRGLALAALGDAAGACDELERSLEMARARNADYDVALALRARARIDASPEESREDEERSREILERLGVVYLRDAVTQPESVPTRH